MLLHNLRLGDHAPRQSLHIQDGLIRRLDPTGSREPGAGLRLHFDQAMAFPGLINSHDHLDFNSFPLLGNRFYPNYVEWGKDIHVQDKEVIDQVRQIPKTLRVQWGLYKNLLNGITTVVNHGPPLEVSEALITVFQQCHCLHSVRLEPRWRYKLNKPGRAAHPFVIHIGEGTDPLAAREIDELIRWNIFRRPLIGVHGVAMTGRQAARFRALVWCPDSNLFLLGKTAAIPELKAHTTILFGTDSTLSGSWNLWDQLRLAQATGMAGSQELLDMLTCRPAAVWHLPHTGRLAPGLQADVVVAREKQGLSFADNFCQLNPEDILLVLHRGEIKLFDASLYQSLKKQDSLPGDFSSIVLGQERKFVKGDLPALLSGISRHHPGISFPVSF
jgi:cytosine/adenosine deaminase-related metal-dependent hydrolase